MKSSLFRLLILASVAILILTGCALRNRTGGAQPTVVSPDTVATQVVATETDVPTEVIPTPTALPSPTATTDPAKAQAAQATDVAKAYFAALENGDSAGAAKLVSNFSLMVFNMTQGDAQSALDHQKAGGGHWSDFAVSGTQPFIKDTLLVHVTYTYESTDSKTKTTQTEKRDELWPFRLESGKWRYNWNNLIDYHTLEVASQTYNGITITPTQINRYSDRIELVMLMQNRTNDVMYFGQTNETLGTFTFGDQSLEAEKTQIILEPQRSKDNVTLVVKGLFEKYPDKIEIRKWKNYPNTIPWFTFALN